ncbi:MAG TPA: hypothetical protein VGM86_33635 [Thermoanaerobaculia bacterium]|jgi:hypothetical protein
MTAGALAASAAAGDQPAAQPSAQTSIPDRGPRLDPDLVRDFVIAGHHDLNRVRELLDQHPTLINAAWDWGGGAKSPWHLFPDRPSVFSGALNRPLYPPRKRKRF